MAFHKNESVDSSICRRIPSLLWERERERERWYSNLFSRLRPKFFDVKYESVNVISQWPTIELHATFLTLIHLHGLKNFSNYLWKYGSDFSFLYVPADARNHTVVVFHFWPEYVICGKHACTPYQYYQYHIIC